jgi:hypothetical protein
MEVGAGMRDRFSEGAAGPGARVLANDDVANIGVRLGRRRQEDDESRVKLLSQNTLTGARENCEKSCGDSRRRERRPVTGTGAMPGGQDGERGVNAAKKARGRTKRVMGNPVAGDAGRDTGSLTQPASSPARSVKNIAWLVDVDAVGGYPWCLS